MVASILHNAPLSPKWNEQLRSEAWKRRGRGNVVGLDRGGHLPFHRRVAQNDIGLSSPPILIYLYNLLTYWRTRCKGGCIVYTFG